MNRHAASMDTILTYNKNDVPSEWSVVWSTSHIPGMDNATGGGARHTTGRRRLRLGALGLACCLAMHCRIAALALTGGIFVVIIFLLLMVVLVGNPLRHFEVYLGQWSLSGPGRAFRIIPMLDGIGIAICINCIIRAICCCCMAAMAAIYVYHSVSDKKLPFSYCRDFDLKPYDPTIREKDVLRMSKMDNLEKYNVTLQDDKYTVGFRDHAWRESTPLLQIGKVLRTAKVEICHENFTGNYPALYKTPAYNFFYVEVMLLDPDRSSTKFNLKLLIALVTIWFILWFMLIYERITYGKLIWNNVGSIVLFVPFVWIITLTGTAVYQFITGTTTIYDKIYFIDNTIEMAMYIHSASTGTELIHGKGLNHYASGHIDPNLNSENVMHSVLVVLVSILQIFSASICSVLDYTVLREVNHIKESTVWILPLYSRCIKVQNYSHAASAIIFGGLMLSYMIVAFIFMKSALHTIFEYRVKLVFVEQLVVGSLMITCMLISLLLTKYGGIQLLESVDALMTGISMPFVCMLELVALLYLYRSHDFLSDIMVATEENSCSTRIGTQWQSLPIILIICLICKITGLSDTEMDGKYMLIALAPVVAVLIAVPLRAIHNAYVFLSPSPRRET